MNKPTQIKPIQTKKPVCTLAFQFWLSSKLYIYIYIYICHSNKKGRIELHPQQDNLPHMLERCSEKFIQYLLNRHVWQLSKCHLSAASMILKSNSIVSFWLSSLLRRRGNMAPDVLRPKDEGKGFGVAQRMAPVQRLLNPQQRVHHLTTQTSNNCLLWVPLDWVEPQQGLLVRRDVDRLWNEENHPLIGPTPFIVQSTVVPKWH